MQRTLIILAHVLLATTVEAKLPTREADRIVRAIYRVEGGPRAKVPYGILSVPVRSQAHARQICTNTFQNTHNRWLQAGKPGAYLDFLANRYCPKSADALGNRRWKQNINAILAR